MLAVYRVSCDIRKYRYFKTEDKDFFQSVWPRIHGERINHKWAPPGFHIANPKGKTGHFFGFCGAGAFAIRKELLTRGAGGYPIGTFLDQGGEDYLPFKYKGGHYLGYNCTNCLSALDEEKSVFGKDGRVKKYVFHRSRFMFSLFTIPETRELLCVEGLMVPTDEFKGVVEASHLQGLIFEELWSEKENPAGAKGRSPKKK
jgi:hypothetical protein